MAVNKENMMAPKAVPSAITVYGHGASEAGVLLASRDRKVNLVVGLLLCSIFLLLSNLLGLFLLLIEVVSQPSQAVTCHNQASGNDCLAASDVAIPTALLVLASVGREDIILTLVDDREGQENQVKDGPFDLLGILLDNGEGAVDLGETAVSELVGFLDVWSDVAVGTLSVGDDRCDNFVIAFIGEFDALLAIRAVLDSVN